MNLEPTGWCAACGRVTKAVFCNPKCLAAWEREQRVQERRVIRRGKRDSYGGAQNPH